MFSFSVGYSTVALNHVIDFKEKKQVILFGSFIFSVLSSVNLHALLHVPKQLYLQNARLDASTNA